MKSILSTVQPSSYRVLSVVVVVLVLIGCPMPTPPQVDTVPPALVPTPVTLANNVQSLVNGARDITPTSDSFTIVFAEPIRPVSGTNGSIILRALANPGGAVGASESIPDQTFRVNNSEEVRIAHANLTLLGVQRLAQAQQYSVIIPASVIEDSAGNDIRETTLSFTTGNDIPHLLSTDFVVEKGSGTTTITVAFNEPITIRTAADIRLVQGESVVAGVIPTIGTDANANTLILTANSELDEGQYVLSIVANALVEQAVEQAETALGNEGIAEEFTIDTVLPALTAASARAPAVVRDTLQTTITLSFTEPITLLEGVITLRNNDTTVAIASSEVAEGTNNLVLTIASVLESGSYTLSIPEGAVIDAVGNENAAVASIILTVNSDSPALISPERNFITNGATYTLSLEFDRSLASISNASAVSITGGPEGTPASIGTIAINPSNASQLDIPISNLQETIAQTAYTITVAAGAIADGSNNENESIAFTLMVDTTPPELANDPVEVNGNEVTIEFSENIELVTASGISLEVDNGSGTFTEISSAPVSDGIAGDALVVITLAIALADGDYRIVLASGAVSDGAGNTIGMDTVEFTIDSTPPVLLANDPVEVNGNEVTIEFSENIELVTASGIRFFEWDNSSETHTEVSDATVSDGTAGDAYVVITLDSPLADGIYSIVIASGAVSDGAGNATVSGGFAFLFDTTPPELASDPVEVNGTEITIEFSENIVLSTAGNITLEADNGSGTFTEVSGTTVSDGTPNDVLVVIMLGSPLAEGDYRIVLASGAVRDYAGNDIASAMHEFTIDGTAPTFVSSDPSDNEFVNEATLTFTFSEDITIANESLLSILGSTSGPVTSGITLNASGRNLVLTVSELSDQEYTVNIPSGSIQDSAGNGLEDSVTRIFTFDSTPPMSAAKIPAHDRSANTITITFSETIQAGSGSITLSNGTPGEEQSFALGTSAVSIGTDTLTLNEVDFADETEYTVGIAAGAVTDIAGNENEEITIASEAIRFTTLDTTPPEYISGSGSLDRSARTITLIFNEPNGIQAGNGIIRLTSSEPLQEFDVTMSDQVEFSGPVLTLRNVQFIDSITYTITIPTHGIEDAFGNANTITITDTITTGDTTSPVPSANIAVIHDRNAETITIGFNENIFPIQETTGNITLLSLLNNTSVSFDIRNANEVRYGTDIITLNNVVFADSTDYSIAIPAMVVQDASQNPNADISHASEILRFSTIDITAPTLVDSTPNADEIINRATRTITFMFSEDIRIANESLLSIIGSISGPVTIGSSSASGRNLALTVSETIDQLYTVRIPSAAIQDLEGNSLESFVIRRFTLDTTSPTDNVISPSLDSILREAPSMFTVRFSESIELSDSPPTIAVTGASTGVISNIQVDGRNLMFNVSGLTTDGEYMLSISANAVYDSAGNGNASIMKNFRIDSTPPEYTTGSVSHDRSASTITITFSEIIQVGSGIITLSNGTPAEDQQFTLGTEGVSISENGDVLILNSVIFEDETDYQIELPEGAVTDAAGNPNEEIANSSAIRFRTLDTTLPEYTDNSVTHDHNTNTITITFSETIQAGSGIITLSNGTPAEDQQFTLGTEGVSISENGDTLTLNTVTFEDDTLYTIGIPAGAITDTSGNAIAEITTQSATISFRTEETVLPEISIRANNVLSELYIDFSQIISSINESGITLEDSQGNTITGTSITTVSLPPSRRTTLEIFESVITMAIPVIPPNSSPLMEGVSYTLNFAYESIRLVNRSNNLIDNPISTYEFTFPLDESTINRAPLTLSINNPITVNRVRNQIDIEFLNNPLPQLDNVSFELMDSSNNIVSGTSIAVHNVNRNTVVMSIATPLTEAANYTLLIQPDDTNNIDSEIREPFTVPSIKPDLVHSDPVAVDNDERTEIRIEFTESISITNSAGFTLEDPSETLIMGTNVSATTNIVIMTIPSSLGSGNHTLKIAPSSVSDGVETNNQIDYTFTVAATSPVLADDPLSIVSDATQTSLIIEFNENITLLNEANIKLENNAGNNVPYMEIVEQAEENFVPTSDRPEHDPGNTLIMRFNPPLPEGSYTLNIDPNAVSNVPSEGGTAVNNDTIEYNFSITAPNILATNFVEIGTATLRTMSGVTESGGRSIFIKFDENITVVNPTLVNLFGPISRTGTADIIRALGNELEITLPPEFDSSGAGNYALAIGAGTVSNDAGITNNSELRMFSLTDITRPALASNPSFRGRTTTQARLILNFNEPIVINEDTSFELYAGTNFASLTRVTDPILAAVSDTNQIILTISANLRSMGSFRISINNIRDMATPSNRSSLVRQFSARQF